MIQRYGFVFAKKEENIVQVLKICISYAIFCFFSKKNGRGFIMTKMNQLVVDSQGSNHMTFFRAVSHTPISLYFQIYLFMNKQLIFSWIFLKINKYFIYICPYIHVNFWQIPIVKTSTFQ